LVLSPGARLAHVGEHRQLAKAHQHGERASVALDHLGRKLVLRETRFDLLDLRFGVLPDARDQRPAPRRTAHRGKGFAPARHAGQRQRRAGAIVELAVEAFVVCRRCRPT